MSDIISDAISKLSAITEQSPVNWDEFESVLESLENINIYDEQNEETILSEFIMNGDFLKRGELLADIIRHFLSCGYDVSANEGMNGGLALSALCWSSYDQHILHAAKVLMNAGAPVKYKSMDDEPGEEHKGLIGSIGWKLPGAWVVDKDFSWANILEAYYAMAEANIAGKDYNSIDSYHVCLDEPLSAVSAIGNSAVTALHNDGAISVYTEPLVMWFGDKPLAISCYTDFVVNPVYAIDKKSSLTDVSSAFSAIVGATLKKVQYIGSTICYFEFSNGKRLIFAGRDVGDKKRIGTFEIRAIDNGTKIENLGIDCFCGIKGVSFADTVTDYTEDALALFCDNGTYLLYLCPGTADKYQLRICPCSKDLLKEYTRLYPLKRPANISCFFEGNNLSAIRFDFVDGFLYLKTTKYYEIEVQHSDNLYNPLEYSYLPCNTGKHIEFERKE